MKVRTSITVASIAAAASAGAVALTSGAAGAQPLTLAATSVNKPANVQPNRANGTSQTNSQSCQDGKWIAGANGANVNGTPPFDTGDTGAAYLYHDQTHWHLRTTDRKDTGAHFYQGSITLYNSALFTHVSGYQLEKDDSYNVKKNSDGTSVLSYSFVTYGAADGLDFEVAGCSGTTPQQTMKVHMEYNGRDNDPLRIYLGGATLNNPTQQPSHPVAATFMVHRTI